MSAGTFRCPLVADRVGWRPADPRGSRCPIASTAAASSTATLAGAPWWPSTRSAAAGSAPPRRPRPARRAVAVPDLDGELTTDPAALAAAADDFGHIVHRTPLAVLRPGSVRRRGQDRPVRQPAPARRLGARPGPQHRRPVPGPRRRGDRLPTLARIHEIRADRAVVDAGRDLAGRSPIAALARGLTPPVLHRLPRTCPSAARSAPAASAAPRQRYGMQVDNVLELEVVTGEGELVRCSPTRHRGALPGRARQPRPARDRRAGRRSRLVPGAGPRPRLPALLHRPGHLPGRPAAALAGRRFTSLQGQVQRNAADTGWEFFVDAAVYYDAHPAGRRGDHRGLRFDPARTVTTDYTYLELDRPAPRRRGVPQVRSGCGSCRTRGSTSSCRPARRRQVVAGTLAELTLADTGQGPVLLYPFRPGLVRPTVRPGAGRAGRLPVRDPAHDGAADRRAAQQLADNRVLYERARDAGGKRYPVGSVPLTRGRLGRPLRRATTRRWSRRRRPGTRAGCSRPGQGIFGPPR